MSETLTRSELVESVYNELGLSKSDSSELVELVISEICDALVSGESVKISSFASFLVHKKTERLGRNPRTGEEVPISPRKVILFRPSQVLRERVNGAE